jgi:hypothetical protein
MTSSWRKSSYSGGSGGDCTEVATVPGSVLVRDSKDADGLKLSVGTAAWKAFTEQLKKLHAEHPRTPALARASGGVLFPVPTPKPAGLAAGEYC